MARLSGMIEVSTTTPGGYEVPLYFVRATTSAPIGRLLLLPAMGVEARFYVRLAAALAARGLDVALVEQRGHGRSSVRASRDIDFGWRQMIFEDAVAALEWLAENSRAAVGVLMGHSLGGHHAAILSGQRPGAFDGLVLAATGTPWVGAYSGRTATSIRALRLISRPLSAIVGHYPGAWVGFGGREARTAMADWVSLAGDNRYVARGADRDLDGAISRFSGPTLSLRMKNDPFAPEAAIEAVLAKLGADSHVTRVTLDESAIGQRADHYGWAKAPEAASERIAAWCASAVVKRTQ